MPESLVQIARRALIAPMCVCGKPKQQDRPFCVACYVALPQRMRAKLYRGLHDGFAEAYDDALTYLQAETDRLLQRKLL